MRASALLFTGACCWLLTSSAFATYSIVAVDTATGQVGGTGTSCLNGGDVYGIYGSAPGKGAVHSQARSSRAGRDEAVELLDADVAPADIIATITEGDDLAERRQYGVVDLQGRSAGFTGANNGSYAGDVQGVVGTFVYSSQGNILTGPAVLEQASLAFEGAGCDLAERLMLALEAGGDNGEGDSRCTPDGIPSDSAYLQVDLSGEPRGSFLALRVESSGNDDPRPELRALYEAWRADNPCPVAPPDAGVGQMGGSGGEAGGGSAGTADPGGSPATAGSTAVVPLPASGMPAGASGQATPVPGVPPASAAGDDADCACRLGRQSGVPWPAGALLLLCALGWIRRSRFQVEQ